MDSMESVKTSLIKILGFFQTQNALYSSWDNRYVTALVIFASIFYRLIVIRKEIQRRRREIGHGFLEPVFTPADAKFEIIAVQGLGSDPSSTWQSKKALVKKESDLLEKLLPQRLPNARISKFIYNSDWDYDGSIVSPKQLGENLIDAFERHVEDKPLLPVVFICHSFGGIVTKYALVEAGKKSKAKDKNIWGATRGVIFLGTPHQGSSLSYFALAISYLNRLFGSRRELVAGLQPSNQNLIDLGRDFQNQLNNDKSGRVRIQSVQEMKQVMLFGLFSLGVVVDQQSAMMHAHRQSNWNRSHTELNKFPGIEDDHFVQLVDFIEKLAPSAILQKVDERLRDFYGLDHRFKIFPFSKTELDMDNCYINLGRIEGKSRAIDDATVKPSQQSIMARLRIQETNEEKRLELSTIFEQKKPRDDKSLAKRFLIRGQAGIGKSTLCKKILYQFYHKEKEKQIWRTKFDRIFWIPLRQVPLLEQGNKTLNQLLAQVVFSDDDKDMIEQMIKQLELDKFDRTLFLLDGMDEVHSILDDSEAGFIPLLKNLIDKPNVIVTSRPHFRVRQREVPFDIEAEVLGFTPTQVDHYINNSGYDNPEEIRSFLENNPLVQSLARIPIQLDAICYTWNFKGIGWDSQDPPRTMTELYQAMEVKFQEIDMVRRKHLVKTELEERTAKDLNDIQKSDTKLMESLAFAGLCLREVNFDSGLQDITKTHFEIPVHHKEPLPSILHDLSFFRSSDTVLKSDGFKGTYHFLHLTFQEYFAARYFVRHWKDGKDGKDRKELVYLSQGNTRHITKVNMSAQEFLHRHKYFPVFDVFWRFVSGLLKPTEERPEDLQDDFFKALEDGHRDLVGPTHQRLVMHCLAEASSNMPLRSNLESMISRWLYFELWESKMYSELAKEAEVPDSVLSVILQQPPANIQSYLLKILAKRSHLSRTLLEIIEDLITRNADNSDICQEAYTVLRNHRLTSNIIVSMTNRAKHPDDKIGLAAIKVLARHGCLQDLSSDVIKRYIEHKDPEVLIDLLKDLKSPPRIFLDHLREWRRDKDQKLRAGTIRFLESSTDIENELFESCLAPLEDDDLSVLVEAIEMLKKQPSLTRAIWQAFVKCFYSHDFDTATRRPLSRTSEVSHLTSKNDRELQNDLELHLEFVHKIKEARIDLLQAQQEKGGLDLASLLVSSQRSRQKYLLEDLCRVDRLSHHILHALTQLLECDDVQIYWTAFWMVATQEDVPKACIDTMSGFLLKPRESWDMARKYLPYHRLKKKWSDQFLQSLTPLLRTGRTSVRRFCIAVLSTQSNLTPQLLDVVGRTFPEFSNTNRDILQLFETFKVLPEQVEETIARLLCDENSDVRSRACRILQRHSILRQSTLQIIARYLQNPPDRATKLAAITALYGSREIPPALWDTLDLALVEGEVEDEQETRQLIYRVLSGVNDFPPESWERLTQVLEGGNPQHRIEFFDCFLQYYKGVMPDPTLQHMISLFPPKSENQRFRRRIAQALGPRIYESNLASDFIKSLLNDYNQVQLCFAQALNKESHLWKPDTDIILPLLERATGKLRERIVKFIWLRGGSPVTDPVAAKMVSLLKDGQGEIRKMAGYVLARHRSGANLHIIASLFRDSDRDIYQMASNVLRQWKTQLPTTVLDVLAEILEDPSMKDDVKEEVLCILGSANFDHGTKSSKALVPKILALLGTDSLAGFALHLLRGYDNLSSSGLEKAILKVKRPLDQTSAFALLVSRCDEVCLSSFVNNPQFVGKFFEVALDWSWYEAVSIYFVDDKTIQVNIPIASKTVTLDNPEEFRKLVTKERGRLYSRRNIESPWGDEGAFVLSLVHY